MASYWLSIDYEAYFKGKNFYSPLKLCLKAHFSCLCLFPVSEPFLSDSCLAQERFLIGVH